MKTTILFKVFLLLNAFLATSIYANAQGNCDSILKAYYASAPNLPKLEYELSFCRGARSALKQNHLSICTIGHPKDISPCTYFAYERYGVKLCIVEDPARVDEAEAENAGHNFIMRQRIKREMPDKADLVGVEDPEYFVISENLNTDLEKVLRVSEKSVEQPVEQYANEKARKKAEKKRLKAERKAAKKAQKEQGNTQTKPQDKPIALSLEKGKYAYLSEAKITDLKSGKVYKFSDLYNGIEVMPFSEGDNRKLGLQLDITNIDVSKVCKNQLPKRKIWAIQLPLKGKL